MEVARRFHVYSPFTAWIYPFALAQYFAASDFLMVGVCGAPGSGKSTVAAAMAHCTAYLRPGKTLRVLALDGFYYSPEERRRRGLRWRAQPGSHDLAAAEDQLRALAEKAERAVIEGWIVGKVDEGYEVIARHLDFLVYVEFPTELAMRRRFQREDELRSGPQSPEVFSNDEMKAFWCEVLEPGITRWVRPLRETADLILVFDDEGNLVDAAGSPG